MYAKYEYLSSMMMIIITEYIDKKSKSPRWLNW